LPVYGNPVVPIASYHVNRPTIEGIKVSAVKQGNYIKLGKCVEIDFKVNK